ncbi:MAG: SRPBCC family protein [Polyangiaceae bacterium]
MKPDPKLDLLLERVVDVPPELVWKAWTEPEHLKQWFTPKPWQTVDCEIELRPGGIFKTVMRSPEGDEFPNAGCYLEVVPNRRLVWTGALERDYRPVVPDPHAPFMFTAYILLDPEGTGTRYRALVIHSDEDGRQKHEAMGFHDGWGKALDQLVEYMHSKP